MIEKYQTQAKESGAVLLPFSGFDSIPSEVSLFNHRTLQKKYDAVPCGKLSTCFLPKAVLMGEPLPVLLTLAIKYPSKTT